jgi:hypothetical protein
MVCKGMAGSIIDGFRGLSIKKGAGQPGFEGSRCSVRRGGRRAPGTGGEHRVARCLFEYACFKANQASRPDASHSIRSARIGANAAARVAGTTDATSAAMASAPAATPSAIGSQNDTP